jgi:hypothetical protein
MADTSTVSIPLDILDKYSALVSQSLNGDSVYIRAKETVIELVADGSLDDAKKSEIISSIIGGAVNGITSAAMSGALDWAKYEKELALKKLELDQQLLILEKELLLKTAQADEVKWQTRLAKVESRRMYGTGTFDVTTGALITLSEEGKVWNDMQLVTQQTSNAVIEEDLLTSKINESKAAIHKVVADTYVNYGSYTYTQSSAGITGVTPTHGSYTTLSDTQQEIAVEQGKGYTYNAWANALTGSASMLGTVIASGVFNFATDSPERDLLYTVKNCAENLNAASGTAVEAIPAPFTVPPAEADK